MILSNLQFNQSANISDGFECSQDQILLSKPSQTNQPFQILLTASKVSRIRFCYRSRHKPINQMTTFISLLRGINVGGHNQIKMEALRQLYAGLGYAGVQSYIQSGNVIFNTEETDTHTLEVTISEKIYETFGFKVHVLVITTDELENTLKNNPYPADTLKDPEKIYISFLSGAPDRSLLMAIQPSLYAPDEFSLCGKVIYNYCPNGYGKTKLTNTFFENKLKVTATNRNLKTSIELLKLAEKNQQLI